jgi:sulfatase modifying factor 1
MVKRNFFMVIGLCVLLLAALGTTGSDSPHSYMGAVYTDEPTADQDVEKSNYIIPDLRMELVRIEPGTFGMGSPESDKNRNDDERLHDVTLTKGLWLGSHEVTVGQFQQFVQETGHVTQSEMAKVLYNSITGERIVGKTWRDIYDDPLDKPIVGVSARDAYAFCRWLTNREQKAGRLPEAYEFTLPTEAQWEYACRAGSSTRFSFGDGVDELCRYGNYADRSSDLKDRDEDHDDGYKDAACVGSFQPNAWGLYDMHGNVFELCSDTYWGIYQDGETIDPLGPAGVNMAKYVVRGGAWSSPPRYVRSAARHAIPSIDAYSDVGFRVALNRRISAIVYTLTAPNAQWRLIKKGNTSRVTHKQLGSEEIARVIHFPEERSLGFLQARIPALQTGWVYIPARAQGHLEVPKSVEIKLDVTEVDVKSDEGLTPLDVLDTKDLVAIEITEKKISNNALRHIARLTGLREVTIESRLVRDSGLEYLCGLIDLEMLDLSHTKVRGPGLDYLERCSHLTALVLSATKVTNEGLQHLPDHGHLRVLKLDDTVLGDPRYKGYRQKYSDDFMAALDTRDKLDQISQYYVEVEKLENSRKEIGDTDGYFKPISHLSSLEALDLSHTYVANTELIHLSNLTNLEVLRLADTPITSEGLKHLASLTKLKEIDVSKTGVDDDGLAQLSKLTNLEKISAGDMWKIPQEGAKEDGFIQRYQGNTPITDEGLRHLAGLKKLQSLRLAKTKITGRGISYLINLKDLKQLYLRECRLQDDSLTYIAELRGLEVLDISGNPVTDAGLGHLLGSPNLKKVVAVGTLVTDNDAKAFMKQKEGVEVILEEPIEIEY